METRNKLSMFQVNYRRQRRQNLSSTILSNKHLYISLRMTPQLLPKIHCRTRNKDRVQRSSQRDMFRLRESVQNHKKTRTFAWNQKPSPIQPQSTPVVWKKQKKNTDAFTWKPTKTLDPIQSLQSEGGKSACPDGCWACKFMRRTAQGTSLYQQNTGSPHQTTAHFPFSRQGYHLVSPLKFLRQK